MNHRKQTFLGISQRNLKSNNLGISPTHLRIEPQIERFHQPNAGISSRPPEIEQKILQMQTGLRLENVPDLEFLSSYERSKIASSLVEVKFEVRRRGWFLTLVNGSFESMEN